MNAYGPWSLSRHTAVAGRPAPSSLGKAPQGAALGDMARLIAYLDGVAIPEAERAVRSAERLAAFKGTNMSKDRSDRVGVVLACLRDERAKLASLSGGSALG